MGCGLWSGLDCEIKGCGPIMSNFHFFGAKILIFNFFENTVASALKSCIIRFIQKFKEKIDPEKVKKQFF